MSSILVVIPAYNEEDCVCEVIAEVHRAGLPVSSSTMAARTERPTWRPRHERPCSLFRLIWGLAAHSGPRFGMRCNTATTRWYRSMQTVNMWPPRLNSWSPAAEAQGSDMVVGSRFSGQRSDYRISVVRRSCIRLLANRVKATGLTVSDPTSGFRLIRKPLLEAYARSFPSHYLGDTLKPCW